MGREAGEELGDDMGRVRLIFTHKPLDSKWNQDVRIYAISGWEGTPTETESTKPEWFNKEEIPWDRMWEDNQHWLPKVLAGQRVDATFLFSEGNKVAEFRFDKVG